MASNQKKGNLIAIVGDDEFNKGFEVKKFSKRWLGDAINDGLSRDVYYGEDLKWEAIAGVYDTVSMFSSKRLILVRSIERASLETQKNLVPILKNPNDQTMVIFTGRKMDGRSPLTKLIKANGAFLEFKTPYPDKIPAWVQNYSAQNLKRKIDKQAALLLQEFVGDNLQQLGQELEKLDNYLEKGFPISEKAIQSLILPHRQKGYFELQKLMGLQKKGPSLRIITELLNQGEPAFLIAMNLFYHFNKLLKIRQLHEKGIPAQQIPNHLNLNQFIFKKENFLAQAMQRPIQSLKNCLILLAQLEGKFKRGYYSERFEIELAFAEVLF